MKPTPAIIAQQKKDELTLRTLLEGTPMLATSFVKSLLDGEYGIAQRGYWTEKQWDCIKEITEAAILCMSQKEYRQHKLQQGVLPPPSQPAKVGSGNPKVCSCGKAKSPHYPTCYPCAKKAGHVKHGAATGKPVNLTTQR